MELEGSDNAESVPPSTDDRQVLSTKCLNSELRRNDSQGVSLYVFTMGQFKGGNPA